MKCPGCGAVLQFDDPRKPGYIPLEVYERKLSNGEEILCQRCYRLKHYGKMMPVELQEDFKKNLKSYLGGFDVVLWILDIFDFEGSYDEEIKELLKNKKVVYGINKIDLIPKAVTLKEIKEWLKKRLNVNGEDIRLMSAARKLGLRSTMKYLKSLTDKALVIGVTNVGKSSILNELCGYGTTVSPFPGTTLGIIRRKVKDVNLYLYDTPGIVTGKRIIELLDPECQKRITPLKRVTRKTFKPESGRVIFIGGLCRLDIYFEGEKRPIFQIFSSESVVFHETSNKKADTLMRERMGDLLVPPCKKESYDDYEWEERWFNLNIGEELAIAGLGWLSVRRGPFKVKVTIPRGIKVVPREALVNPYR